MTEELPAGAPFDPPEDLPGDESGRPASPSSTSSRLLAVLAYVAGPLAAVALFVPSLRSEDFVRYHATQALVLWGTAIVGGMLPCVGPFVVFVVFVAGVLAAIGAWSGDYSQIPFVSGFVSRWVWP